MAKPVLMLGLDGWSQDIADTLVAQGRMPTFARLREESAVAKLDHGDARRSGLAWEHVATGRSPDDAKRWAAVDFDPATYQAAYTTTRQRPFIADLPVASVVFDAPYCDLASAKNARGLVNWGAHDPGVPQFSRPPGLSEELRSRFGTYPATRYIYGEVWYDPNEARAMADALVRAVEVRSQATEWLLAERLPDWDLALVVISEFHSATEALYHGWDTNHPLHGETSSAAARDGIVGVYEAVDRMVARLLERFPDARFVLFNLHGMGPNDSDVASMALLPELMYRMQFGRPYMRDWPIDAQGRPKSPARNGWSGSLIRRLPRVPLINWAVRRKLGNAHAALPLGWMPAAHYKRFWRHMDAFALPSYYDGRVRVNLAGRERHGAVPLNRHEQVLDQIEAALLACRHVDRDWPIVAKIERNERPPLELGPSEADLVVVWNKAPQGLVHDRHGQIGPLPYRRPGGHTGGQGIAYFHGEGIAPDRDIARSAFDVVPTVIEMLGHDPRNVSGGSFASLILR
jgi:predicted AlkP superfamily phosphohydrolase/phosphomutase